MMIKEEEEERFWSSSVVFILMNREECYSAECLKVSPYLRGVCVFVLFSGRTPSVILICCPFVLSLLLFVNSPPHPALRFISSLLHKQFFLYDLWKWEILHCETLPFSLFQGMTLRSPVLLSKQSTASVSFTTRFTRGASRSFKDAKTRNTVSDSKYLKTLRRFIFSRIMKEDIVLG